MAELKFGDLKNPEPEHREYFPEKFLKGELLTLLPDTQGICYVLTEATFIFYLMGPEYKGDYVGTLEWMRNNSLGYINASHFIGETGNESDESVESDESDDESELSITHIEIHGELRGKGYAKYLITLVLEYTLCLYPNITKITLDDDSDNTLSGDKGPFNPADFFVAAERNIYLRLGLKYKEGTITMKSGEQVDIDDIDMKDPNIAEIYISDAAMVGNIEEIYVRNLDAVKEKLMPVKKRPAGRTETEAGGGGQKLKTGGRINKKKYKLKKTKKRKTRNKNTKRKNKRSKRSKKKS